MNQQPTIETITPETARSLLQANGHNRNLRQGWVDHLAGAMARREWVLNGSTIKVCDDGTLLDGQHRLQAVVVANVPIETVVVRGLPLDARDTVDVGRKRQLADVLAIEGYTYAHGLAAAVNVLHRYRTRQRIDASRSGAPTPQQALTLLQDVPELHDSVRITRSVTKAIGGPLGVFAALHTIFQKIDQDATDRFFSQLTTGLEFTEGDPVWHLRQHIQRPRNDRHYAHTPHHVAGLTIKAFNYRRAGRKIDVLAFKSNERFPTLNDDPYSSERPR